MCAAGDRDAGLCPATAAPGCKHILCRGPRTSLGLVMPRASVASLPWPLTWGVREAPGAPLPACLAWEKQKWRQAWGS